MPEGGEDSCNLFAFLQVEFLRVQTLSSYK